MVAAAALLASLAVGCGLVLSLFYGISELRKRPGAREKVC
jgi:hypothetical protein